MEETEKELLKLFDYYRIEGKEEINAENYLTIIDSVLQIEKIEILYNQLGRLLQHLKSMKRDIDNIVNDK